MTLGVYAKCTPKEITPTTLSESAINEIPFALDNGHGADLVRQLADLGMQGLVEVEATEMIGADRWELLLVTCWCVPEPHIGPHDVSCVYLHPTCVHVRDDALCQVVSRAVVIATGITAEGGQEIFGVDIGDSSFDEISATKVSRAYRWRTPR